MNVDCYSCTSPNTTCLTDPTKVDSVDCGNLECAIATTGKFLYMTHMADYFEILDYNGDKANAGPPLIDYGLWQLRAISDYLVSTY